MQESGVSDQDESWWSWNTITPPVSSILVSSNGEASPAGTGSLKSQQKLHNQLSFYSRVILSLRLLEIIWVLQLFISGFPQKREHERWFCPRTPNFNEKWAMSIFFRRQRICNLCKQLGSLNDVFNRAVLVCCFWLLWRCKWWKAKRGW